MSYEDLVIISYFIAVLERYMIVIVEEWIVRPIMTASSKNETVDACPHECAVVVDAVPLECTNAAFPTWICAWFLGYLQCFTLKETNCKCNE